MIKHRYIDIENVTFCIEPEDEVGKGFDDGVLFALETLSAMDEDVTRCKECAHRKVCFMTDTLGDDGFCSLGIKEV